MTAATFGAVAVMRAASWSTPPELYWSWHGRPNGVAEAQFWMIDVKPMSLPPICSDTVCTEASSALNCGGFGPGVTFCAAVMSSVLAPLQDTSVSDRPSWAAARWAKLRSERRQPNGLSDWLGISGPAANESPSPTHWAAEAGDATPRVSDSAAASRATAARARGTERMGFLLRMVVCGEPNPPPTPRGEHCPLQVPQQLGQLA
jgi:hypothetical protein